MVSIAILGPREIASCKKELCPLRLALKLYLPLSEQGGVDGLSVLLGNDHVCASMCVMSRCERKG